MNSSDSAYATAENKFTALIRTHVTKKGISNKYLQELAAFISPKECQGVFSVDMLPQKIFTPSSFIVNLAESGVLLSHFVAVIITPSHVFYADPYGLPPPPAHSNRHLDAFLRRAQESFCKQDEKSADPRDARKKMKKRTHFFPREKKKIFYSGKQVQALNSKFCGLYSLLFCAASEKQCKIPSNFFKSLSPQTLVNRKNDKKCLKKLQEIVRQRD